ncbi:hypothetical protein RB597_002612 [Gaeumannomyces tritici]
MTSLTGEGVLLPSTPEVPPLQVTPSTTRAAAPTMALTPLMSEQAHIAALQKGTPRSDAVLQRAGRLSTEDEGGWSWETGRGLPQSAVSPGSGGPRSGYSQRSDKVTPGVSGATSAKTVNTPKSVVSVGFKTRARAEASPGSPEKKRGSSWGFVKFAGKSPVPEHGSPANGKSSSRGGDQRRQQKNQTGSRPRRVSFDTDPITDYFPPHSGPRAARKEDAGVQVGSELMDMAVDDKMSTRPWKSLGMAARRKSTASASNLRSNISARFSKAIKRLSRPGRMLRKPKPPSPIPPGVTLAAINNGLANERRPAQEFDPVFPGGEAERIPTPQLVEDRSGKRRSRIFDLNRVSEKLLKGGHELVREADGGKMAAEAAALKGVPEDDKDPAPPPTKPTPQEAAGPSDEQLAMLLAPEVRERLEEERTEAGRNIKTIPINQELSSRVREFDFHMAPHKPGAKVCPLTTGEGICVYHGRRTAPVVEEESETCSESTSEMSEEQGPATA